MDNPTRSYSEPIVSGLLNISQLGRLWATTNNLNGNSTNSILKKKKVKFLPAVRVVLIPSRTEYALHDLLVALWWDDSDYASFKLSAVNELKNVMKLKKIQNSKEAIEILYQPGFDNDSDELLLQNNTSKCTKNTMQNGSPASPSGSISSKSSISIASNTSNSSHKTTSTSSPEGSLPPSIDEILEFEGLDISDKDNQNINDNTSNENDEKYVKNTNSIHTNTLINENHINIDKIIDMKNIDKNDNDNEPIIRGFFNNRTDVELTDHYNFTKTKHHYVGEVHPNASNTKSLSPLAYLCD